MESYLVIICSNLVLYTPIWPQITILSICKPYLPIFTTICLYLAIFRLNYPYFGIFALIAIVNLYMYSSIKTAPLCKILEQSDHYSWRYCISKTWGYKCHQRNQFGANLVIDIFYVASGT